MSQKLFSKTIYQRHADAKAVGNFFLLSLVQLGTQNTSSNAFYQLLALSYYLAQTFSSSLDMKGGARGKCEDGGGKSKEFSREKYTRRKKEKKKKTTQHKTETTL